MIAEQAFANVLNDSLGYEHKRARALGLLDAASHVLGQMHPGMEDGTFHALLDIANELRDRAHALLNDEDAIVEREAADA